MARRVQMRCKTWMNQKKVRAAVREASIEPVEQMASIVEANAKKSMQKGGKTRVSFKRKRGSRIVEVPSPPGTPPHRQTGTLAGSIEYARATRGGRDVFIVGPTSPPAWYGVVHEFGGRNHPPRPFMRPAFLGALPFFRGLFRGLDLQGTRYARELEAEAKRFRDRHGRGV